MIEIPAQFAAAAIRREGEAGRQWLARLPGLFADFCRRWGVTPAGPPRHGYLGLVLPVRRGADRFALKISADHAEAAGEAAALAAWNGAGAVRLYEWDAAERAMLLEWLDGAQTLESMPITAAALIGARLLRRLAIKAPAGFRHQRDYLAELHDTLPARWEASGRPGSRRLLDRARALTVDLAAAAGDRLVNWDLAYENVLAGEREPWLAVDPKAMIGSLAHGVLPLVLTRLEEMEAARGLRYHLEAIAAAADLDQAETDAWVLVRCLDYWLWAVSAGLTFDPLRCARIAAVVDTTGSF